MALLPFLVVFGIGAAVVGLFVAAVAVIGAGIGTCFTALPFGVLLVGIGLLPVCIGTCWSCVPEMGSNLCTSGNSALILQYFCCRIVNRGRKEGERA
mgnify:CR=1 FL=1